MHTTKDDILVCTGLAVGYRGRAVLSSIDLRVSSGRFISLLGPNGAGKTTLLRTISGHQPPVGGTVMLAGRPLPAFSPKELARVVAVVLTGRVAPPLLSVFDFAALGRFPHTGFLGRLSDRDRTMITEALALVGAEELADREFAGLSDGEMQKVLIARALAQEPRLLLLDEPTSHLDMKHRVELMTLLCRLCSVKNISVIASLHDLDIATMVSDSVMLMRDGVVVASGAPEDVLHSDAVASLYDVQSAMFDSRLGRLEMRCGETGKKVFVIAGLGKGASVFRLLARYGFGISAGVLFENDLDCHVAENIGVSCISQPPAGAVGGEALQRAMLELEQCDCVVDCSVTTGVYAGNKALFEKACSDGKKVYSLGCCSEGSGAGVLHLACLADLSRELENM